MPISSGFSGPTVAGGYVYVTDAVTEPEHMERIHCFESLTGESKWTVSYPCDYGPIGFRAGPRASMTVDEGRAYALGAVGHFYCLDATTGEVLWNKNLVEEYKISLLPWGIAPSPLVEQDLVILQIGGSNGACVVAFDKKTGQERWTALEDPTSYASPIMIEQAGRRQLVCWTGTHIAGLDPISGRVFWRYPFAHDKGWIDPITTPVSSANRLFVSCPQDGAIMLKLSSEEPQMKVLWEQLGPGGRRAHGFHSSFAAPIFQGEYLYGTDNYGCLRCLDVNTGEPIWEDRTATTQANWATTHMVCNGDRIWIFNDRGELIISRLSPQGFELISRAQLIEPTRVQFNRRAGVCWSHPAFANKHVYARNDEELVCASLAADEIKSQPLAHTREGHAATGDQVRAAPPALVAPFDADEARQSQQAWAAYLGTPAEYQNMLGMKCVLIPPGEFDMGSPPADLDRLTQLAREGKLPAWYVDRIGDEGPQHHVKISKPFYMSRYEVTVKQFRYLVRWGEYRPAAEEEQRGGRGYDAASAEVRTGTAHTWEHPGFTQTDEHPVVNVSWNDAVAFCEYLTSLEGDPCRMPTEAEWEYACRCGALLQWTHSDDESRLPEVANVADTSLKREWSQAADRLTSPWDDGYPFTAPVGRFQANAFGLFDMHGNVWEWCQDWHDHACFGHSPSDDPAGPETGVNRVLRGGSWNQIAPASRSAFRYSRAPSERSFDAGFRVVQTW
ncbi:MAG: SUMF1/EgtB/PvdO family nonheme iron enzyme [Pirellulaceae bacterium]